MEVSNSDLLPSPLFLTAKEKDGTCVDAMWSTNPATTYSSLSDAGFEIPEKNVFYSNTSSETVTPILGYQH